MENTLTTRILTTTLPSGRINPRSTSQNQAKQQHNSFHNAKNISIIYDKERNDSMFESYDDILTPEEVAEALRIGMNAMYDKLRLGEIHGFRNGRSWRISKESLIEYVRKESKA